MIRVSTAIGRWHCDFARDAVHRLLTGPVQDVGLICLFFVEFEKPSMSISDIALSAVVANHAQAAQAMTNAAIKQQHTAELAIVRMLDEAVAQSSKPSAGGVDITV